MWSYIHPHPPVMQIDKTRYKNSICLKLMQGTMSRGFNGLWSTFMTHKRYCPRHVRTARIHAISVAIKHRHESGIGTSYCTILTQKERQKQSGCSHTHSLCEILSHGMSLTPLLFMAISTITAPSEPTLLYPMTHTGASVAYWYCSGCHSVDITCFVSLNGCMSIQ